MVTLEGSWGPSGQSEAIHPRTGIPGQGCPLGISAPGPAPCHACHRRERFSCTWGSGSRKPSCAYSASGRCSLLGSRLVLWLLPLPLPGSPAFPRFPGAEKIRAEVACGVRGKEDGSLVRP